MTSSHTRRRSAALVAAAVMTLAACGDDDTVAATATTEAGAPAAVDTSTGPGVDEATKTITVASISALSPPFDIIGVPAVVGQRAYFEELNAAGGIDGWTIELIEADSQYNPQLHKQLYDEMADDIAMVSQSVGSPTTAAIVDDVIADGMTVLPASLALPLCRIPNMVAIGTPYQLDVINGFQWLTDERDAGAGDKAAIVYQDDEYGQDALAGYQTAMRELDFESTGEFTFARTDTDFAPLVQRLQDSGASYVQLAATPAQTGPIIAQAAQAGFSPTWLLSGPSWDEALLTRGGLPAEAFDDAFVVSSVSFWGEEGVAGMDDMLAAAAEHAPEQDPSTFFLVGYAQAHVTAEVLRGAIASGDLTRAGIAAAAADLTAVDMFGLMPDLSISGDDRIPSRESSVFEVDPTAPSSVKRVAELFSSPVAEAVTCS